MWNNPTTRESLVQKIRAHHLTDRYKESARAKALEQWQRDGFRDRWLAQHKASWSDPEPAAARRAHLKSIWSTKTEAKEKVRAAVTKAWTPERRAAIAEN